MEYILQGDNINKRYDNHQALKNVSVRIPENSIFGLLGPNGAGKTTLIRIINQIIAPDDGHIQFKGEELKPFHISKIGYLPEERGLYKKMKVGEQALYLAKLKEVKSNEAKKLLKYWFEKFDLMPWWDRKVEELSKGMQQKLQFIITVLHKPDLLIFDEPFSGFDPLNVNLLKEEILQLKKEGTSIIFSTHNMSSVEELCENIALINKSEKILDGNLYDVKKQFAQNIYSVALSDLKKPTDLILDHQAEVLSVNDEPGDIKRLKLKLAKGVNSNEIITQLIQSSQLVEFHEELPGMNDIFIRTVTQGNTVEADEEAI